MAIVVCHPSSTPPPKDGLQNNYICKYLRIRIYIEIYTYTHTLHIYMHLYICMMYIQMELLGLYRNARAESTRTHATMPSV